MRILCRVQLDVGVLKVNLAIIVKISNFANPALHDCRSDHSLCLLSILIDMETRHRFADKTRRTF